MGGLVQLLAYNPKAKIVWAHGASDPRGAMTTAAIGRLMDKYPNLSVSLWIVGAEPRVMKKALTALVPSVKPRR